MTKYRIIEYFQNPSRELDEEMRTQLTGYYRESVTYVAKQLQRLITHLQQRRLYEESLIVISGDHGEESLEQGFYGHRTIYDANIWPGMIVKPPADSEIVQRDEVDLIDICPTVAKAVTGDVPE
jgi:arylsulfatase A-like enzyme